MLKIENLCEKISDYISRELSFDEDKKSVINYGIFASIQMIFCIMLVIIFGFIFNVMVEALIVSFTTSILRKSSGGVHASSPGKCAIIGTISTIIMALVSKKIYVNFIFNLLIGVIIFVFAYYIIYKLAPVDSISKPIKSAKKRIRLKKITITTMNIYLMIVTINILGYLITQKYQLLIYSMCIYMGILWQVFSLTKKGHAVLTKIDSLF